MSYNANTINNIEPSASGAFSFLSSNEYIRIGQGQSSAYSTSPASAMTVGSQFYFYDSAPLNTVVGASVSSGWSSTVTLPAGQYHFMFQSNIVFSASGYFAIGLYNSSDVNISTVAGFGANGSQSSHGLAFLDLASTETFTFKVSASTNAASIASQGNTPSQYGHIFVLKVQ